MKKIAIYDFDGTLYNGETISDFYFFSAKENKLLYLWLPYFAILLLLKKLHLITLKLFKQECFRFFGRRISTDMVYKFWGVKKKYISPWVRHELALDKKRGYYTICISATPEFLLSGIVLKYLNFDAFIGTRLNTKDNRKIIGKNCKGKEKVSRLYEFLKKRHIKNYKIKKMVSDSLADMPLYKIAERNFVVKKDGTLKEGLPTKYI